MGIDIEKKEERTRKIEIHNSEDAPRPLAAVRVTVTQQEAQQGERAGTTSVPTKDGASSQNRHSQLDEATAIKRQRWEAKVRRYVMSRRNARAIEQFTNDYVAGGQRQQAALDAWDRRMIELRKAA